MPIGSVGSTGLTEISTIKGALTVAVTDVEIASSHAVIDVVPAATPVTLPLALTVAMFIADELQATTDVRSALLPSL